MCEFTFFPLNKTSFLQPCDAGINRALKAHHCRAFIPYCITCYKNDLSMRSDETYHITQLQAMFMAQDYLEMFHPIHSKIGFVVLESFQLWQALRSKIEITHLAQRLLVMKRLQTLSNHLKKRRIDESTGRACPKFAAALVSVLMIYWTLKLKLKILKDKSLCLPILRSSKIWLWVLLSIQSKKSRNKTQLIIIASHNLLARLIVPLTNSSFCFIAVWTLKLIRGVF